MYYQYELAHFKGNMGHDATSDAHTHNSFAAQRPLPLRAEPFVHPRQVYNSLSEGEDGEW